jgi:hypothetical protein
MMPVWSELPRPDAPTDEPAGHRRPRIGVILYRAHYAAGNIAHIIALADAPASSVPIPAPTMLELIGSGNWRSDEDLAEVCAA